MYAHYINDSKISMPDKVKEKCLLTVMMFLVSEIYNVLIIDETELLLL